MRRLGWVLAIASLLCAGLAIAAPSPAQARDLYESDDGEFRLTLRSALKGSWILSYPYLDDPLREEAFGGAGLFRLRFELGAQLTEYLTAQIAYEHRSLASSTAGLGAAVLPPGQSPPFRLAPLDWVIVDGSPNYLHRHEIDRAFLSLHLPFAELTVGRQAIGLGRGVLFSAIDVFSAFGPNEVDREWRRGVDAVHLELRIPDLEALSGDVIAVFGNVESGDLESYSVLGRLRAVVGDADGELIVGRRGEDTMVGGALSATVGDAEVHGELALFGTDGAGIDGGIFGTRGVVAKGLLGGSYMIDVFRGVRVVLEYHYSGFGVENVSQDSSILLDAAYVSRALRGHSQTLGRHTLALSLSTDLADDLSLALVYFQSPTDGSGLMAPALSWVPLDMLSIAFNVLLPWGTSPSAGIPRSEWGSSPFTVFLQARIYD
jgi:hypothetical protein